MDEQEVVTQPAEQTAPTDSAPVEMQAADTQQEPAEASFEPEKKVSESVPYERFREVNERTKDPDYIYQKAMEMGFIQAPAQAESAQEIPQLDPDSAKAVEYMVEQKLEQRRQREFYSKHSAEFSQDPILAGTVNQLIAREQLSGRYIDHETVYGQAKKMLDEKLKPVVKQAQSQGFQEGQQVAQKKEQLGEVGTTGYKAPQLSEAEMSAAEFAKQNNIPRI